MPFLPQGPPTAFNRLTAGGVFLEQNKLSKATLGRVPVYLSFLKSLDESVVTISATMIAKQLGFGEVQVRKDLGAVSATGKPRVGYLRKELTEQLEKLLENEDGNAVIVGAGQLGKALLDYGGFKDYGINILAAFDIKFEKEEISKGGKKLLPLSLLSSFCRENNVKLGVIAVPQESAQEVCNLLCENGIRAIWCFAPLRLYKPADVIIQYENMALSLAHLKMQIK